MSVLIELRWYRVYNVLRRLISFKDFFIIRGVILAKLFIYYSVSGNGDVVADKFKELGYDIRKVESKLKLSKHLVPCMIKGGYLASIGAKSKLINYNNDVSNYEEVIIGSPIWNTRFASPINTVLRDTNLNDKELTFVLYSGSGTAKKAEKKIKKNYPKAKIIILKQPKDNPLELNKLEVL